MNDNLSYRVLDKRMHAVGAATMTERGLSVIRRTPCKECRRIYTANRGGVCTGCLDFLDVLARGIVRS